MHGAHQICKIVFTVEYFRAHLQAPEQTYLSVQLFKFIFQKAVSIHIVIVYLHICNTLVLSKAAQEHDFSLY